MTRATTRSSLLRRPLAATATTTAFVLVLFSACAGCRSGPVDCGQSPPDALTSASCALPDWPEREFDLHLPDAPEGAPMIVFFHGGGGNRVRALDTACPAGAADDPECLHLRALEAGYIVVVPDGTKSTVGNLRTWNAGGGTGDYRCTAGKACEDNVDDVAFFDDLLAEVKEVADYDAQRVYLTGISNGAAMSYRLACARSDQVAAIAPVAGGNQSIVSPGCSPSRAVPLLHFHGTADPAWRYEGGEPERSILGQPGKRHVGIEETIIGGGEYTPWTAFAGCRGEPSIVALEDAVSDGTSTEVFTWATCEAPVTLVRIEGGGHTWPLGWPYLDEETVGLVAQDFSANQMILEFFEAHRAPQ